ncbi:hypothetical protein GmRootV118_22970 [Variovorax sp. V118]
MALTRKNAKPGKGMQYELDLVGAVGRTKLSPTFVPLQYGLGTWCRIANGQRRIVCYPLLEGREARRA